MKLVGLTGGIGSGKSTVGQLLALHGAAVCDVDALAHAVLAPGEPALADIRARFGADVFHTDDTLNRAALASIVFSDPVALRDLEQITHPLIHARLRAWVAEHDNPHALDRLVVVDHPLLLETQDVSAYDAIVVVICDETVRRQRLIDVRGLNPEDVTARIAAQTTDAHRRKYATHVIDNSHDENALASAVSDLYTVLTTAGNAGLRSKL